MKLIKIFSVALLLLVSSFANAKAQESVPFCESYEAPQNIPIRLYLWEFTNFAVAYPLPFASIQIEVYSEGVPAQYCVITTNLFGNATFSTPPLARVVALPNRQNVCLGKQIFQIPLMLNGFDEVRLDVWSGDTCWYLLPIINFIS